MSIHSPKSRKSAACSSGSIQLRSRDLDEVDTQVLGVERSRSRDSTPRTTARMVVHLFLPDECIVEVQLSVLVNQQESPRPRFRPTRCRRSPVTRARRAAASACCEFGAAPRPFRVAPRSCRSTLPSRGKRACGRPLQVDLALAIPFDLSAPRPERGPRPNRRRGRGVAPRPRRRRRPTRTLAFRRRPAPTPASRPASGRGRGRSQSWCGSRIADAAPSPVRCAPVVAGGRAIDELHRVRIPPSRPASRAAPRGRLQRQVQQRRLLLDY